MDHSYLFVKATSQVQAQAFQEIAVVRGNWPMDLMNPTNQKHFFKIETEWKIIPALYKAKISEAAFLDYSLLLFC